MLYAKHEVHEGCKALEEIYFYCLIFVVFVVFVVINEFIFTESFTLE